jgi:hypothetical protein
LKRVARAKNYYKKKLETTNIKRKALNLPAIKSIQAELAKYGY